MDDDILKEFISEAREHLADIESNLLAIEEGGANIDEELVNKVFRAAHSIKGGSGFFGLDKIKDLAHKTETILDMLRSRRMVPNAEIVNLLLASFDKLREMVNNTATSESANIGELVTALNGLASSYLPPEEKSSLTKIVTVEGTGDCAPVLLPQFDFEKACQRGLYIYSVEYDLIHDVEAACRDVLGLFSDLEKSGEILDCTTDFDAVGDLDGPISNRLPLRLVHTTALKPETAAALFGVSPKKINVLYTPPAPLEGQATNTQAVAPEKERPPVPQESAVVVAPEPVKPVEVPRPTEPRASESNAAGHSLVDETLRVSVGLLETLMNLAGELVLSRNQLRAAIAQREGQSLSVAEQRLDHVTSDLQDVIMQTRLQPIGNLFAKFPRMVRDLSSSLHKEIQLDVRGKDVALDRSLLEGLSDPMTHMVRNAIDHGIESPSEREKAGKKRGGSIRIEARHEAGQIVVEVADDGAGIDPKRVSEAALRRGQVTVERLQGMSEQERMALIFLPGLSTKQEVSDVSGRGVGLDVVKTNLDHLGGKIEIKSEIGKGTLFRIKLPLTLAIIPSLIVSVEGERFAIPQINVEELFRVRAEDLKKRIEVVGGAEVLLLRDRILPLIRFSKVLGVIPTYVDPATERREIDRRTNVADRRSPHHPLIENEESVTEAAVPNAQSDRVRERRAGDRRQRTSSAIEIAVVTNGTTSYGLVVDAFHDTEEIVVKPLGRHFKELNEYAGATILGDGSVVLILDVTGLASKGDLAAVSNSTRSLNHAATVERERLHEMQSLLLFHNAPDEVCAVPLEIVQRIERISRAQINDAGGRMTIQYLGASLSLVTLADTARVKPIGDTKDLAVIVSGVRGRDVGLLGAMPVDVIETGAVIDQVTHRQKGIAGSAIIRDRTTLISDIFELVDAIYPEWGTENARRGDGGHKGGGVAILLAEDSDFFRAQVKRFLQDDGYTVWDAVDGEAAWEVLLEHVDEIKIVVTDVEMPRLNGLGLAQRIRADERTTNLPVIALSSLAGEDDVARGKAAGIGEYLVKLDRDRLLESIRNLAAESQSASVT